MYLVWQNIIARPYLGKTDQYIVKDKMKDKMQIMVAGLFIKDKMQIRVAGLFGKNKLLMRIECPGSVWNNTNTNTFANKKRN